MEAAGKKHRRTLVFIIALVVVASVMAALVLLLAAGSSPSAPTAADLSSMRNDVQTLLTAKGQALSPQNADYQGTAAVVSTSVYDQSTTGYQVAVQAVGTPEFVAARSQSSPGKAIEGMRANGDVMEKSEAQVLSTEYMRTLDNGDVVVWTKVWYGEVRRHYASGKVGVGKAETEYVDETPTYQYQMRNVAGQWKIVAEAMVYWSEDSAAGPEQYGPNTPHFVSQMPMVSGDQGLVLGTP